MRFICCWAIDILARIWGEVGAEKIFETPYWMHDPAFLEL